MTEYKAGDEITIPTSYLGSVYGIGKVISVWADGKKMAVDFKGHLGHYTLANHDIYHVPVINGIKLAADPNIPKNEIRARY